MKVLAKRLVYTSFSVLSALSVVSMVAPNESAAAPGFRPRMPMAQPRHPMPPGAPATGHVMQSPQVGANNFIGGSAVRSLNHNFARELAGGGGLGAFGSPNGAGFNGFASGLGAVNTSFRGFGAFNSSLINSSLSGTALRSTGFNGFGNGFNGFNSGLNNFSGFGVPALGGFTNLNGFNTFNPGTKFGFNGGNGL